MAYPVQGEFSKKTTDLPDVPSPTYTAAQIKDYIQTPSNELKATLIALAKLLNATAADNSGADNLGATDFDGVTASNVQSLLNALNSNKADIGSNWTGTWQGYTPSKADPGISSVVDRHSEQIEGLATVNVKVQGAVDDKTTDNSNTIDLIIGNTTAPAIVYIPLNIKWDYRNIAHPDNIFIIDNSGYDWMHDDWTAQRKVIVKTDNPGTKNANEEIFAAPYHPAQIIDNVGDGTTEKRASTVYRQNGTSIWRVGKGVNVDDQDFLIAEFPSGALRFGIKYGSVGETGHGGPPVAGVAHAFYSSIDGTAIYQYHSNALGDDIEFQYFEGSTLLSRERIEHTTGRRIFIDNSGSVQGYLTTDLKAEGFKNNIKKCTTTTSLAGLYSKDVVTNEGSSGGFILNLPDATEGIEFTFVVIASQNMRITPQPLDQFRSFANGKYKESSSVGSMLKIFCATNGIWEIANQTGVWTDEA